MSADTTQSFKGYALFDESMEADSTRNSKQSDWYPPAGSRAAKALEHLFDGSDEDIDAQKSFLADNSKDREWVEEDKSE
ncbi:hypothetical protein E3P99_00415 [Wallemia hederae]|uniref:Uncharacterized protein n=1 Tax=Wallemia hederae TaxID=1540922 RepID=A0A4V4LU80_9BASI|nr:hypothetical protein E3P99_00415 [Wallemia hederae]